MRIHAVVENIYPHKLHISIGGSYIFSSIYLYRSYIFNIRICEKPQPHMHISAWNRIIRDRYRMVSTVSTMSTVSIILLDSVNSYSAVLEFIQELTGKYSTATLSIINVWVQLKNKYGWGQKRLSTQSTLLGDPPRTILSSPLRRGLRRNCTITDRWQGRAPSKGRTSCLSLHKRETIIFGYNIFLAGRTVIIVLISQFLTPTCAHRF